MTVTLNGGRRTLGPDTTVASLVDDLGRGTRGIAVAVNETVVPRSAWPETSLRDGDRVEILTAAQGG